MKLRFLHICLSESWGGLEMAVSRWNEVLREHGHKNLNICTPGSPLAEDLKKKALPLLEWDSAHYFAPDFTYKLRQLVKQERFHAVILQNLRDLWIVSPALYNIKTTQLIGFAQMLLAVKKNDPLHRLVYKRLDHLLTLTDWQQQALRPFLPVPPEKYKTIPNFVDTTTYSPKRRSVNYRYHLGYTEENFLIGVIGRIDEQKGQLELLQAFHMIKDKFKNARLLIVGEPTIGEEKQESYFHHLKSFVSENKMSTQVQFLGFQKDTSKLTASMDLFVLPSHQETFGYVVVEAMASGTPVLATQAGGVPEILLNGECGYLAAPKDAKSLAERLEFILENRDDRESMAQNALQRAQSFYDRHKVYARFIKIVRQSTKAKIR